MEENHLFLPFLLVINYILLVFTGVKTAREIHEHLESGEFQGVLQSDSVFKSTLII